MPAWALPLLLVAALAASPEQGTLLGRLRSGTPEERRGAVLRLAEIGDAGAAEELARALRDSDADVREAAGDALWAIWHRSGDPAVDALLRMGIRLMDQHRLAEAVVVFSRVIEQAPGFAEGWNKRATAYYLLGDHDRSLADCEEVVRRNSIHFGALSGFGLNYLQKDDLPRAAEYFERALRVNPNLSQVEAILGQLRELLLRRARPSI